MMKVINTKLKGCVIIEPEVHGDDRGFLETFQENRYKEKSWNRLSFCSR